MEFHRGVMQWQTEARHIEYTSYIPFLVAGYISGIKTLKELFGYQSVMCQVENLTFPSHPHSPKGGLSQRIPFKFPWWMIWTTWGKRWDRWQRGIGKINCSPLFWLIYSNAFSFIIDYLWCLCSPDTFRPVGVMERLFMRLMSIKL